MEFRWKVKERARTYISRMEDSVQGEGGSAAMFKVAVVLMRGFSLSEAEGMELLSEWNETHARPRWSPTEMRHKIADGAKADRPEGYVLQRERQRHHTPSHQKAYSPRSGTGPVPVVGAVEAEPQSKERGHSCPPSLTHHPLSSSRQGPIPRAASDSQHHLSPHQSSKTHDRTADKSVHAPFNCGSGAGSPFHPSHGRHVRQPLLERERRTPPWPAFSPLTDDDRDRIAILRKVPCAAVEVVRRAGLLGKAHYEGHDCFIMGEGTFAQARRFDGGLLPVQGGRQQSKAKNLPGSEGAFIGRKWALGSQCPVLLVEGVIGLVEAIAALMMARDALDWTCLAAVSASSRFARDPYLLHALAGRKVHIVPDAGTTGWEAAGAWLVELEGAGAQVQLEPVPLPVACKDLGDVVSRVYQNASPDDDIHFQGCVQRAPDDLREYLKDIFALA
ncbi:hypothetical protein [Roseimicrobium sp. ORNL1]|uniref:hypothetical protein n=1 Tax=Roseimicrobium sp. ORNL1 TaxID=2711231 RepID=UPI0013E130D3|nr:hypothetical protein [Roseimicrobium sp. ORNL1]QIF03631.1 hypothetical protein G5S37_19590 [Roseimicrobium sp. ORNL1]